MDYINLVSSSDDNYVQHISIMLASVVTNLDQDYGLKAYVIDGGISIVNKEKLKELSERLNFTLTFLSINKTLFKNFMISHHIKHATYYRILIPQLLHDKKKAIYLDGDIVAKGDISELWKMNISDYLLAAVSNSDCKSGKYNYLGIEDSSNYFNAGVLVLDLEKWREQHISEQVLQFINENPDKIVYWDQDALNAILHDKWLHLHPRWNQTHFFHIHEWNETCFLQNEYIEAKESPTIIHYTASSKPWRYLDTHPLKEEYYKYLKLTNWSNYEPPEKEILRSKKLIIFGASQSGVHLFQELNNVGLDVLYFVDNDERKWGNKFEEKDIFPPKKLLSEKRNEILIIIASDYYEEISCQLVNMIFKKNVDFVIKNFEYQNKV